MRRAVSPRTTLFTANGRKASLSTQHPPAASPGPGEAAGTLGRGRGFSLGKGQPLRDLPISSGRGWWRARVTVCSVLELGQIVQPNLSFRVTLGPPENHGRVREGLGRGYGLSTLLPDGRGRGRTAQLCGVSGAGSRGVNHTSVPESSGGCLGRSGTEPGQQSPGRGSPSPVEGQGDALAGF